MDLNQSHEAPPRVSEHTDHVLTEHLRLSPAEITMPDAQPVIWETIYVETEGRRTARPTLAR